MSSRTYHTLLYIRLPQHTDRLLTGNHAQALALAARMLSIPAHIVMPTITTPSKISGTRAQGAIVHFSGSTADEREAVVADIIEKTGATMIPPYDHPHIMIGQGTMALDFDKEVNELLTAKPELSIHFKDGEKAEKAGKAEKKLDALIAPCGGGGMLSGNAIYFHGASTRVFGAEPEFEGADDARRGVAAGERILTVKTLTIADGLRSRLGEHTWKIVSNKEYVAGLFAVTEQNIKDAMRLVLERMKCFVEPSAVVGLATVLYNEEFRKMVEKEAGEEGWDIGLIFSGGNTTIEAIIEMFSGASEERKQREEGVVSADGKRVAENVAG